MMLNLQQTDVLVKSQFHPSDYPSLKENLGVIDERMANLPILHKADLLIASLKGQAINPAWTAANPAVANLLLAPTLPVQDLETLFSRSRNVHPFRAELETYIRNWFKVTTAIY
ncbi:MAG: hypothetical protein EOP48_19305 [Sphingobacteriales bacterium]|nr:MAG: hypothetical protein EOP48_19305 [Sphingobacteriales bacterium]